MVIRKGEQKVEWPSDKVNTEWNGNKTRRTHRLEWSSEKVNTEWNGHQTRRTQSGMVIRLGGHRAEWSSNKVNTD